MYGVDQMMHNVFELLMRSRRHRTAPGAPVQPVGLTQPESAGAPVRLIHEPEERGQMQLTTDAQQRAEAITRSLSEEQGVHFSVSLLFS